MNTLRFPVLSRAKGSPARELRQGRASNEPPALIVGVQRGRRGPRLLRRRCRGGAASAFFPLLLAADLDEILRSRRTSAAHRPVNRSLQMVVLGDRLRQRD